MGLVELPCCNRVNGLWLSHVKLSLAMSGRRHQPWLEMKLNKVFLDTQLSLKAVKKERTGVHIMMFSDSLSQWMMISD